MEHFSLEDGQRLAREVYGIFRLGGCFRVVVPDADLLLRRYFDTPDEMVARRRAGEATPMEIVNVYCRQRYEHQFLYIGRLWRRCFRAPDLKRSPVLLLAGAVIACRLFWTTKSMSGKAYTLKR